MGCCLGKERDREERDEDKTVVVIQQRLDALDKRLSALDGKLHSIPLSNLDVQVINGIHLVLKTHITQVNKVAGDFGRRLTSIGSNVTTCIEKFHVDLKQVKGRVGVLEEHLLSKN